MRASRQPPSLKVTVQSEGDRSIVSVAGEVDMSNSPKLREALFDLIQKRQQKSLVVDLAGVPSMDSSGIATLMESLHEIRKSEGNIILVGVHESLRGVLSLTGLLGMFDIRPTVDDARDE
jgi:anti-anti-sigma factor